MFKCCYFTSFNSVIVAYRGVFLSSNSCFQYQRNPHGFFIFIFILYCESCSVLIVQPLSHGPLKIVVCNRWDMSLFIQMNSLCDPGVKLNLSLWHTQIQVLLETVSEFTSLFIADHLKSSLWIISTSVTSCTTRSILNQSIALYKDSNSSHGCKVFSQAAAEVLYIKVHLFFLFL